MNAQRIVLEGNNVVSEDMTVSEVILSGTHVTEITDKTIRVENTYKPARGADELLVVEHYDAPGCSHIRPATDSDNV